MPDGNNCFWHLSAVANFTTRHGFCSILGKNTTFCVYSVHVKYWCTANSNLAYFIELTTAHECQKQLLMSSISNSGSRESLEIAVNNLTVKLIFHLVNLLEIGTVPTCSRRIFSPANFNQSRCRILVFALREQSRQVENSKFYTSTHFMKLFCTTQKQGYPFLFHNGINISSHTGFHPRSVPLVQGSKAHFHFRDL